MSWKYKNSSNRSVVSAWYCANLLKYVSAYAFDARIHALFGERLKQDANLLSNKNWDRRHVLPSVRTCCRLTVISLFATWLRIAPKSNTNKNDGLIDRYTLLVEAVYTHFRWVVMGSKADICDIYLC